MTFAQRMTSRIAASLRYRRLTRRAARLGADSAEYYDSIFSDGKFSEPYRRHYADLKGYFLFAVIADRLRKTASILEIGCGTGQLALLLHDVMPRDYVGLDFSAEAVGIARQLAPGLDFRVGDALTSELLPDAHYDAVIATEVLEHTPYDLAILSRIRPGARVVATVPDFDDPGHCRHFPTVDDVYERYRSVIDDLDVTAFKGSSRGNTYYIIDGRAVGKDGRGSS